MVQEGEVAIELSTVTSADTLTNSLDSIAEVPEPVYGIVLTPPPASYEPSALRPSGNLGVSFILTGLFILFLIIALRFRNNIKYVVIMFRNLVEIRTRHNVFDDTVRETSLIVLLNILWVASCGIIGYVFYSFLNPEYADWNHRAIGMLWGMTLAGVYVLFMCASYAAVGSVFSDKEHMQLWLKGFSASQALMAVPFFIGALVAICQPELIINVVWVIVLVFILSKITFIWKGYRIFFYQISSWVLFLCYLCSLEIVPLILSYRCATLLGKML